MVRKGIGGCAEKRRTCRIVERFELCVFLAASLALAGLTVWHVRRIG